MKISYDEKPRIFESSNKITSLGINNNGNVFAVRSNASTKSSSRENVVRDLNKSRY